MLHPEDNLPPTPTTPLATMTEHASTADVNTDVQTDVITEPVAASASTDVIGSRIGPIESVLIRGRGQSRAPEHSVQAVGLTLTRTAPSPWPMGHEEGGSPARHGSAERITQQLNAATASAAEDLSDNPRLPGNRTRSPSRAPDPVPPTEIVSIEHFRLLSTHITALGAAQVENVKGNLGCRTESGKCKTDWMRSALRLLSAQ